MTDDLPPIDPQPAPRQGASRLLKVVLFLSLALNLLIVGAVAGMILAHRPGDDPRLRDAGLGPLAFVLDREQRDALRGQLKGHERDLRRNRVALRGDLQRLLQALRSDPFDPAVLQAILQDQARTVADRQQIGHQALVEAITAVSPDQRRDMADRIERALQRSEHRDRR